MSIFHLKFKLVGNFTTFQADQESSDYKTLVRDIQGEGKGMEAVKSLVIYLWIRML